MSKFDYLFDDQQRSDDAKAVSKAFETAMAQATQPLRRALEAAETALGKQIKRVEDRPDPPPIDVLGPLKSAQVAIVDAIAKVPAPRDYSEQLEAIEGTLLAEIRALPSPKEVDLSPVIEAIGKMQTALAEQISQIKLPVFPDFPEFPEPKRQWTFHVERNRNTGLIEEIKAT